MMISRYGSQALDPGARPGRGCGAHTESVDTPSLLAGFAVVESVDTPLVLAGFGDAETFYTYKNTAVRTISKTDFATEVQLIRADAKARYGNDFDKP